MLMLSRVAESLMWMSRYLERAGNMARMVEVVDQLALDYRHPRIRNRDLFWVPILEAYGSSPEDIAKLENSQEIIHYLLVDLENPTSVFSSLSYARENARGMREQISGELWEALNEMYLWFRDEAPKGENLNPALYGSRIRQGCLHLRGLIEEMMPRNKTWCFLTLGAMLERADQTSRLLDLKTCMVNQDDKDFARFESYVWLCIMRSCGAGSQRGFGATEADWPLLVDTLIFNSQFPRSVRFCVREVNKVLHWLSGSAWGVYLNDAEKYCGRMLAHLDLGSFSQDIGEDLHGYLDDIQKGLIEISRGVAEAYTFKEPLAEETVPDETSKEEGKADKKKSGQSTQSQSEA